MKKAAFSLLGITAFLTVCAFTFMPPKSPQYLGSKSCKGCHNTAKGGKVFAKWQKTAHANAFKTLMTPEAEKIAKDKGYDTKAAETDFCLSCHVTGKNAEGAKFHKKFKNEEGVGCESCHGPASGYKTKHNKPEKIEAAVKAGLQLPKVADGSAEKQCVTCHNETSPTYKPFDMAKKWAEVKHELPK
jgi:nitrate/TMAO reductase-like tetraheme cytochrome c subunit